MEGFGPKVRARVRDMVRVRVKVRTWARARGMVRVRVRGWRMLSTAIPPTITKATARPLGVWSG